MQSTYIYQRLLALDAFLASPHGFPPLSPWWRDTFRAFYESGRRTLVIRAGRRAGKSSSLCRLGVVEALYGDHKIPPGDVGCVAIVSASRDEAAGRIRTIAKILDCLNIPYSQKEGIISLKDRPIVFKIFSATIAGVSGFTCITAIADEVSKWRDADTGANPATEVLASLRPTMATQPNARLILSSSPLSTSDAHYEAFERGDTEGQIVAHAPTWIANPTVSEEQTRRDEPDARVWAREYAAIPQAAILAAFDAEAIDRAFVDRPPAHERAQRVVIVDPSSGRKDAFTWSAVGWDLGPCPYVLKPDGSIKRYPWGDPIRNPKVKLVPPVLRVDAIDGVDGSFWEQTSADTIVDRIAAFARTHRATHVVSDQREELMLRAAITRRGLRFTSLAWTNATKTSAVEALRRWLATDQLALPPHEKLKRELYAFEEKITPSGALTFGGRGSSHDDYVALLVTGAMADAAGHMPQSPHRKRQPRGLAQTPIIPY